jgi:cysteine synthase A
MVGQAKGYRTVIVIPETQSVEKITLLRTWAPNSLPFPKSPTVTQAITIARPNVWRRKTVGFGPTSSTTSLIAWLTSNPPARKYGKKRAVKSLGFVASVGTGGTLAGTSLFLKQQNPKIKAVCADPYGAAMFSWFKHGNLETKDGDSLAEGIGQMRVTENLKDIKIDDAYRIPTNWP